jgi:tetratricopeptide (TPR) repeat protein
LPALVTTLRTLLGRADAYFESDRLSRARSAYEVLLERSQERSDRAMEVVARTMLAHCHLRRHDPESARDELQLASQLVDPAHLESHTRYRAVLARLALHEGPAEVIERELLEYLHWAETSGSHPEAVDACLLLADHGDPEERELWLQRGIDHGLDHEVHRPLGDAYTSFAALLDERGRSEEALEAYQQALHWLRQSGTPRQVVSTAWAVGSVACRLGDYPLARSRLDEAVAGAERAEEDCADLLALALADLAVVHEAAGDVVEARRLLIRSSALAREQDLPRHWPERWQTLLEHGKRLELDL